MKLVLILLLSLTAHAASQTHSIHDIDLNGEKAMITFWEDARVYWMDKDDPKLTCLQQAFDQQRNVNLKTNNGTISTCQMAGKIRRLK